MKKSIRNNYILSGLVFAFANIFLCVLIVTRPESPIPPAYWIKLGVAIIGWVVMLLSFPFMRRFANLRTSPEKLAMPVIFVLLFVFLLSLLFLAISLGRFGVMTIVLLAAFTLGVGNIFRDYLKHKRKKRRSADRGGKNAKGSSESTD